MRGAAPRLLAVCEAIQRVDKSLDLRKVDDVCFQAEACSEVLSVLMRRKADNLRRILLIDIKLNILNLKK